MKLAPLLIPLVLGSLAACGGKGEESAARAPDGGVQAAARPGEERPPAAGPEAAPGTGAEPSVAGSPAAPEQVEPGGAGAAPAPETAGARPGAVAPEAVGPSGAAPAAPTPVPPADDRSGFEVAGVAAAVRNTRLSMKAGGVLAAIKTREGTVVKQGQPLCSLDTTDLAIRVEGAEVAAKQAQAGVTSAQQDLKRAQELYKGGAATDQAIEKAELGLTMARLQADAARVALKAAQQALTDATLRAPFAGVITKVFAEEGMMVTTMPPTAILNLVDTSVLEVRVPIPERMLAQVKVGQPVVVSLPSVKVEKRARIDRIPEVVDPITRSVEALIRLDNRDGALPAGVYARVRFPGVHPEAAAMLPEGAAVGARP